MKKRLFEKALYFVALFHRNKHTAFRGSHPPQPPTLETGALRLAFTTPNLKNDF